MSPRSSLFCARCIQSTPSHPTSQRSVLIYSHLRLGLRSGLFPRVPHVNYKGILFMHTHTHNIVCREKLYCTSVCRHVVKFQKLWAIVVTNINAWFPAHWLEINLTTRLSPRGPTQRPPSHLSRCGVLLEFRFTLCFVGQTSSCRTE